MSYPVFAYGHDFGNAETCITLVSSTSRTERRIPSVACIGSWRAVQTAAAGAGKELKDFVQANHFVLEYDNQEEGRHVEKYIGQKVFDDGATPLTTHGYRERYWQKNYSLEMLMVGSGSLISDAEYGLHVVTGMPIATYLANTQTPEYVRTALLGAHAFILNGRERIMHVESVRVVMEGAGALIAYGSNQDVLQGVIDIGGLTTDLYVARGQKPRPANSQGFSLGVAAAADRFNELFSAEYGRKLSLELRMELLKQHATKQPLRGVKDASGWGISSDRITAMLESALCEIGQEIATNIETVWSDILLEFETLLIVGGGAHYFASHITERLPIAKKAHRPEYANVAGYASLAEAIAQRSRVSLVQQKGA